MGISSPIQLWQKQQSRRKHTIQQQLQPRIVYLNSTLDSHWTSSYAMLRCEKRCHDSVMWASSASGPQCHASSQSLLACRSPTSAAVWFAVARPSLIMELESVTAFLESYCWVIALMAFIVWWAISRFSVTDVLGDVCINNASSVCKSSTSVPSLCKVCIIQYIHFAASVASSERHWDVSEAAIPRL